MELVVKMVYLHPLDPDLTASFTYISRQSARDLARIAPLHATLHIGTFRLMNGKVHDGKRHYHYHTFYFSLLVFAKLPFVCLNLKFIESISTD